MPGKLARNTLSLPRCHSAQVVQRRDHSWTLLGDVPAIHYRACDPYCHTAFADQIQTTGLDTSTSSVRPAVQLCLQLPRVVFHLAVALHLPHMRLDKIRQAVICRLHLVHWRWYGVQFPLRGSHHVETVQMPARPFVVSTRRQYEVSVQSLTQPARVHCSTQERSQSQMMPADAVP